MTTEQTSFFTQFLDFLSLSERLKCEMRHSWLSSARRESVAKHVFQMAMMAIVCHTKLEHPVDLTQCLKLILIHDLAEAITGDLPFTERDGREEEKERAEGEAIKEICGKLPKEICDELLTLWDEYHERQTLESKLVKALDNLEVQIQHNLAPLDTWEPAEYELVYTKDGLPL